MLSQRALQDFIDIVWAHYETAGRHDLPWRLDVSPYSIVVSEVMLQQTQVARVMTKYREFLAVFPDFSALASAATPELLRVWQGMGYNRRALFLQRLAQSVMNEYGGVLPGDPEILVKLPGIGKATASSIAAFAYNHPSAFIETNIRRVYIHHFFPSVAIVSDSDIMPLVAATLPPQRSREWYWALMDYGSQLAKEFVNPNRKSTHYKKQSKFSGSNREARGQILKSLLDHGAMSQKGLITVTGIADGRIEESLIQLQSEGFIRRARGGAYILVG